jgi:hypothetical protein
MKPSHVKLEIENCIASMIPLFIWGKPGIGKSAIVKQVADHHKMELRDIRAVLLDPVDLRGLPSTTNGITRWNPPEFLPTEGTGILFLDELNAAPQLTQAACYQLILDRKLGEYTLPDEWVIIAAGNRENDRAVTHRMPSPLANRFQHIEMEPDLNDWCAWAFQHDIKPEIISFLRFRPNLLHSFDAATNPRSFPSPRTWEYIHKKLAAGIPPEIEYESIQGTIGEGAAAEFLAFLKIFRSLPNPDAVIMDPDNAAVPTDPATIYALCGALIHRASEDNCHRVIQYADRLQAEFSVMLVRDLIKKVPVSQSGEAFIQWATRHSSFIL